MLVYAFASTHDSRQPQCNNFDQQWEICEYEYDLYSLKNLSMYINAYDCSSFLFLKKAHYGPGLTGRKFRLGSMSDCVEAAVSGKLTRRSPSNFPWKSSSTRSYSSYSTTRNLPRRTYQNRTLTCPVRSYQGKAQNSSVLLRRSMTLLTK